MYTTVHIRTYTHVQVLCEIVYTLYVYAFYFVWCSIIGYVVARSFCILLQTEILEWQTTTLFIIAYYYNKHNITTLLGVRDQIRILL
jgi:hypothetical protein